jgi:hypothetical protein
LPDIPLPQPNLPVDIPLPQPNLPVDIPLPQPNLPVDIPLPQPNLLVDIQLPQPNLPVVPVPHQLQRRENAQRDRQSRPAILGIQGLTSHYEDLFIILTFCIILNIQVHERFKELVVRTSLQQLVEHQFANWGHYFQDQTGATDFGQIFVQILYRGYSLFVYLCNLYFHYAEICFPVLKFKMQVFLKKAFYYNAVVSYS